MRRTLCILLALWASACGATNKSATTPTQPVPIITRTAALAPAEPPPLMWEVEGPNGPLYLFGTMHFGVAPTDLPSAVADRMSHCDLFVIEANPRDAEPVQLADMMMLPDGPSIDEQLGPQRWARLLELLDGTFEPRVTRRLQPWVLEAMLIQRVVPDDSPMEQALLERAEQKTMSVQYLETWKTQVEMLNQATGVEALIEIVDDPDGFAMRMEQMTQDYVDGDVAALEKHIFADGESNDALFADRNELWLPKLEELLERGDAFVAVGAGHLLGEHSVIAMLRERGYEVRRVE